MDNSNSSFIHKAILEEIAGTLERCSASDIESLCQSILKAKRLFVGGAGRSGLIMKCFAMRLMQLGLKVFVVGETITPSLNNKDMLIIGSGSGETNSMVCITEKAKRIGAKIALVTIFPHSSLGKLADINIQISASSIKSSEVSPVVSIQPLGNLFETSLLILSDGVVMRLIEILQIDQSMMFTRHANLE